MPHVSIFPVNETHIGVTSEDVSILKEIDDFFQFDVPGSIHMKRQSRFKGWDGRIHLFKRGKLYRGLLPRLLSFCDDNSYTVDNTVPQPVPIQVQGFNTNPPLYDYQEAAVTHGLTTHRAIIKSPTSSGKSLTIHTLITTLHTRTLIIVPTIGLVAQMRKDLLEYGSTEADIQMLKGGEDKTVHKPIAITTWQNVFRLTPDYFNQFGCIVVDEVHLAKSKSLTHIMEMAFKVPFRFGLTGTLNDCEVHQLVLEGLFGSVFTCTNTATLIQQERVTPLNIKMCVLHYPEQVTQQLRRTPYQEEIDFLVAHQARNIFIAELVKKLKGNTLVLFQLVQRHGKVLYDLVSENTSKTIHYIDGNVDADTREAIQYEMEQTSNVILLASYGTTQLGISIKNLHNLVFAHPAKGSIRVLQSIGRVLRKHTSKSSATLYDLVDDLRIGKWTNHTFNHGKLRSEYYAREGFPAQLTEFNLERLSHLRAAKR